MFAAVLLNAPQLRIGLLSWMGSLVGLDKDWSNEDDYSLRIRTEQYIGSKRDDLRIEAWRLEDDEDVLEVLWTVEVKVGASIHVSSYQDLEGESEAEPTEDVSQLINYDLWLQQEQSLNPSAHIAGFVLALGDMESHLPPDLKCRWECFTWTKLGQQIEQLLEDNSLTADDKLLGRHMVGFIREHLWRDIEMSETTIDFDDIALIRAFSTIGSDCERKINDLVAPLATLLDEMVDGIEGVVNQKTLFKASGHAIVYGKFISSQGTYVCAGISGSSLDVWIESARKVVLLPGMESAINDAFTALSERNADWSQDKDNPRHLLSLAKPLHSLLQTDDQESEVRSFVKEALEDLNQSGIVRDLRDAFLANASPSEDTTIP